MGSFQNVSRTIFQNFFRKTENCRKMFQHFIFGIFAKTCASVQIIWEITKMIWVSESLKQLKMSFRLNSEIIHITFCYIFGAPAKTLDYLQSINSINQVFWLVLRNCTKRLFVWFPNLVENSPSIALNFWKHLKSSWKLVSITHFCLPWASKKSRKSYSTATSRCLLFITLVQKNREKHFQLLILIW